MQLSVTATVASHFVGVLCIYYCRIEKGAGIRVEICLERRLDDILWRCQGMGICPLKMSPYTNVWDCIANN